MEPNATPQGPIIEQVKLYLETKAKLLKYEAIDRSSSIIAELATDLIMVVLALFTFLFLTITLALFAAHLLSSYWEGFGCVALLYLVILLFLRTIKVSIQNVLIRMFVKKVFK